MTTQAKIVAITGASSGVGRATARAFAARGYHVGLIARGRAGLEGARREVEDLGGRAVVCPADVADADAVDAAASRIEETLGPIDVWVNVAMTTVFAPVSEMTPQEYRRVMEVNFLGYVHGTLSALKRMRPRNRGTIVQTGSALAFRGIPLQSAYCASKAAIVRFTDSLRAELLHDGCDIHMTEVHLPAVNTPQFDHVRSKMSRKPQPMPPIFQPEVPAEGIVYAAEHKRRSVTIGTPSLKIMIGNALAPSLVDEVLAKTGYSGQLTDQPTAPDRPDNLYEPAPGDPGAHGAYDEKAKERSLQLQANLHRGLLLGAGAAFIGLLAVGLKGRRREQRQLGKPPSSRPRRSSPLHL